MTDTFRWWFCNSEAKRHEICTKLRKRAQIKIWKILREYVTKFTPLN